MPINIRSADFKRKVAFLCEDEWELPGQIYALEEWLKKEKANLPAVDIVADIGFSMRKDASGGGAALSCSFLSSLAEARIEVWLSEYPPNGFLEFGDEEPNKSSEPTATSGRGSP